MKKVLLRKLFSFSLTFIFAFAITQKSNAQDNVGIGTNTPDASAILEILSANKGILVPRMNTAGMLAIAAPANSLLIYNTDSMCYFFYRLPTTSWISLCTATGGGSGATGPTGPAGAVGATGPSGIDGVTGTAGATGPSGIDGVTGATGPSGIDGVTGAAGATGPSGVDGVTGAVGPIGPTGAAGAIGATGPAGGVGPTGAAGAIGATGPAGGVGPTGSAGAAGATGPTGPTAIPISVSLAANYNVTTTAFTNVPGMSLTFTAVQTSALVIFSSSGYGFTNSMAYVNFRVRNGATSIGGTIEKIQNYDDVTGTITTWSCSYTKLMTGLTVGASYTLQVQGSVNGILGTYTAVIDAATTPDVSHMTLSVIP